jgi:cell division protein FtsW
MIAISRTDTSLLGRWWWTIDRWSLGALGLLMSVGVILVVAAAPAAGERIGLEGFYLAQRQLLFMPLAVATIIGVSLLNPRWVRRLGVLGFVGSIALLVLTLALGTEIKGATRWLTFAGLSLQPSEFAKPCLAIATAWMVAAQQRGHPVPGNLIATSFLIVTVGLLLAQPDVGQSIMVLIVWGIQVFVAGVPMVWLGALGLVGALALLGAYVTLDHVRERIDTFFAAGADGNYQVQQSLQAFQNGGVLGAGPGEGEVKAHLPDAHADFIFAVAGEEFGALACLIIIGLFAFIVLRGLSRLLTESNPFVLIAATGLLAQFGLQACVNMASTLNLVPTKGMTLPFISYGGSSLLALAFGMGMLLALTRRRAARGDET